MLRDRLLTAAVPCGVLLAGCGGTAAHMAASGAGGPSPACTRAVLATFRDVARRVYAEGTRGPHGNAPIGSYAISPRSARGLGALVRRLTGESVLVRAGIPTRVALRAPTVPAHLCGATPAATRADAVGFVGRRLLHDERAGSAPTRVLRIVSRDRRFVAAVAADDPAAVRARIVHFFRDSSLHVVRIRAVTASGRLVNDVGGPYVLAPASARLRSGGRVVGRVTLSIQDDAGYIKLMRRFAGAEAVLRTPAGPVPGSARPGRRFGVFSFTSTAFPSGPLRISLLVPQP